MTHEIVQCSCGAPISTCKCIGPHSTRIAKNGCDACKAKASAAIVDDAPTDVVSIMGAEVSDFERRFLRHDILGQPLHVGDFVVCAPKREERVGFAVVTAIIPVFEHGVYIALAHYNAVTKFFSVRPESRQSIALLKLPSDSSEMLADDLDNEYAQLRIWWDENSKLMNGD